MLDFRNKDKYNSIISRNMYAYIKTNIKLIVRKQLIKANIGEYKWLH